MLKLLVIPYPVPHNGLSPFLSSLKEYTLVLQCCSSLGKRVSASRWQCYCAQSEGVARQVMTLHHRHRSFFSPLPSSLCSSFFSFSPLIVLVPSLSILGSVLALFSSQIKKKKIPRWNFWIEENVQVAPLPPPARPRTPTSSLIHYRALNFNISATGRLYFGSLGGYDFQRRGGGKQLFLKRPRT